MCVIIVCLLYLMVLIDCRTISKSINNEFKSNDGYDVITDLYSSTGNHKWKHHRNLHKHRRAENHGITAKSPLEMKAYDNVTKEPRPDFRIDDTKNIYPLNATVKTIESTTERALLPSSKRRNYVVQFWSKFKNNHLNKKHEQNDQNKKKTKTEDFDLKSTNENKIHDHTRLKNIKSKTKHQFGLKNKKRDASVKWYYDTKDKPKKTTSIIKTLKTHLSTTKYHSTKRVDNLRQELDKITTEILRLKELYSFDQESTANVDTTPSFETHIHPKLSTISEVDYNMGTFQLEQLLNTIKIKATEMIADQNPSVADLISNTVTEVTYDADPIVARSESGVLSNALNTFVSISDVEDMFYKNLASSMTPIDFYLDNTAQVTETHEIFPRSIKEDAMTIAQSVEEILQKQLKKACDKMKHKLTKHIQKGVQTIKSTINKHDYFGKTSPLSHADKNSPKMSKKIYKMTTSPTKQSGNKKIGKPENKEVKKSQVTRPIETEDDYVMLTLYEQILAKTQQDNLMKMVTSNDSPLKVKKRERCRLSKRNPETVSDLKLKEKRIIKRMYDDDINMPEYEYNDSLSNDESGQNAETIATTTEPYDSRAIVTDNLEKTSMEELLEKISFNDFVNGYKHYLKFQKDQANQNFSDLVKYQAHKHHNVDDIGKYILEKIPQLPNTRMKRFFDDTDIDDQELSTKSDESWFKKHFYIFIDNGPPKKYHTSQTISLKYPTIEADDKSITSTSPEKNGENDNNLMNEAHNEAYMKNTSVFNTEINLDDLSKTLNNRIKVNSILPKNEMQQNQPVSTESNNKLLDPLYLIQKMFGGKKRGTLKNKKFAYYDKPSKHEKVVRKKRDFNETRTDSDLHDYFIDNFNETSSLFDLNYESALHEDKNDKLNHKFVNINMVSQPTAIVKIRDNTSTKKNKLKKFVSKFHFRKTKNRRPLKVRRQCKRPPRFKNPLDLLKNIFSIKTIKPESQKLDDIEDFNIVTPPSIQHTKPTRYSKLLSVEEIRKQIPNIPADNLDEVTPSSAYPVKTLFEVKSPLYIYNQPLPNYEMRIKASAVTNKAFGTGGRSTSNMDTSSVSKCSPTDLLMNVNIKTLRPTKELSSKTTVDDVLQRPLVTTEEPLVTPEEFRDEVENIQKQLFLFDDTSSTTLVPSEQDKINQTPAVFDVSSTVQNDNSVEEKSTDLEKVTSHLKNKRRDVLQDGYFDVLNNKEKDTNYKNWYYNDKNSELISKPILPTYSFESYVAVTTPSHGKQSENSNQYQTYSDYFNDFVVWNDDVLNVDKLTTPMWKRILDSIQNYNGSTPGPNNIASKLSDLNDYMNIFFKSSKSKVEQQTTSNYKVNRLKSNVRKEISLELNDKALTESDEVIIEGEAKYFRYNNPKKNENDLRISEENFNIKDRQIEKPQNNIKDEMIIEYRRTNESNVFIDTTLLAYDDDVDSILHDDIDTKKKSRNSKKSVKGKSKLNPKQPTVMTNEHPKQYYTTLLPMSSIDFENFLKQNALDVTLVTSPIKTPSSYVDTWSQKTNTEASTMGYKNVDVAKNSNNVLQTKTTENVSTKFVEQTLESDHKGKLKAKEDYVRKIKYYSDSELGSDYLDKVKHYVYDAVHYKRPKRQRENMYQHPYFTFQPYGNNNARQKKYLDKMKKRMKLFEKKKTTVDLNIKGTMDIDAVDVLNTYEPKTHEEDVEVTIISLNDMKKTSRDDNYKPETSRKEIKSMKYFTSRPIGSFALISTPKTTKKNKNHNDLLYNNALKKISKTKNYFNTHTEMTTEPMNNMNSYFYSYKPPEYPMMDFPYFNNANVPKRVRISGHSYKFDILYDRNKQGKTYLKKKKNINLQDFVVPDQPTGSEGLDQMFYTPSILANHSEFEYKRSGRSYKPKIKEKERRQVLKARLQPERRNKISAVPENMQASELKRTTAPSIVTYVFTSITDLKNQPDASVLTLKKTTGKSSHDKQRRNSVKENEQNFSLYDHLDTQLGQELEVRDSFENELFRSKSRDNNEFDTKVVKRAVETQTTFTAKDVAALEVIVDLMKNTMNIGDSVRPALSIESDKRTRSTTETVIHSRDSLNSIEVHIAVPYDLQNGSKRSVDKGPLRVRKVFSAKMSSPVDLEYQVNSYEGTLVPRTTIAHKINCHTTSREGLSPGMYLLVNRLDNKNGFELKPVTLNSGYDTTLTNNDPSQVELTTKSRGKVILSKEFVAALNKQVMQLLQTIPTGTVSKRKVREACGKSKAGKTKSFIDWEAIKKYFGHDRVCSCKCEPNKTMCRACAASDAVIGELIFEFDNMAKFMKDHCTEIQTFFWMNPSGGKKLRDVVHKLDSNLKDYYKRVKGKCQGRTCQTFSLYLDKRDFIKNYKVKKKYEHENILHDFTNIANDLEKVSKFATCFNKNLTKSGYKMINTIGECLAMKSVNKRSTMEGIQTRTKQNVYSLDNINVNIICNPKMTSPSNNYEQDSQIPLSLIKSPIIDTGILNIIESNLNQKRRNNKKSREFKKLFTKKHNLFTYFVSHKIHNSRGKKRETDTQIEIPLISDSGGTFWHDYMKGKTTEPKILRETKMHEPTVGISVIQTKTDTTESTTVSDNILSPGTDILITVQTTPKMLMEGEVFTIENFSSNIGPPLKTNELGNVDERKPTVVTMKHHSTTTAKIHKNNKPKNKKTGKISKQLEKTTSITKSNIPKNRTMETSTTKAVPKTTVPSTSSQPSVHTISIGSLIKQNNLKSNFTPESNNNNKSIFEKVMESITKEDYIIGDKVNSNKTTVISSNTVTPKTTDSIFLGTQSNDIFMEENMTAEYDSKNKSIFNQNMDSVTRGNLEITEDNTTVSRDFRKLRFTPAISYYTNNIQNSNIKAHSPEVAADSIDSIQRNEYTKQSAEYANLLLSIIKFETSELIDEWLRVATKHSGNFRKQNKVEYATGDYDVLKSIFDERRVNPHKHKRLLGKIANKMRIKLAGAKKSKAERKTHSDIMTRPPAYSKDSTAKKAEVKIVDSTEEAFDPTHRICDLQATYDHISELFYTLPPEEFENYIRNLACYKYKRAKQFFYIDYPPKKIKRWDWIRKKRSLEYQLNKDDFDHVHGKLITGASVIDRYDFENFVKDKDGIYRAGNRVKRTVGDLKDLDRELRNVSPLKPAMNEVYAMVGDTITLDCVTFRRPQRDSARYKWKAEREDMLQHENVNVDGFSVTIHDVQARNVGSYTCSKDDELLRSIRLSVVAPPNYTVLFVPIYSTDKGCDHDDLKAVHLLGPQMSSELSCGERCAIKILEPVCQKGKGPDNYQMKSTAVLTVSAHPSWDCSVQCRRDLQSAFALLCAKSAPVLANTAVVVSSKGGNNTFLPSKRNQRLAVTKTLRKKGTNGHFEYHHLTSGLAPGDVDIVVACPAGFYLIPEQKICVPCPPNTNAAEGANVCSVCPPGTHARPGASACHRADGLLRRYDWWWYPPCGYIVACGGCVFACSAFVAIAMVLHATSRSKEKPRPMAMYRDGRRPNACIKGKVLSSYGSSPRMRNTNPSRVILARFFKPSLTSSRGSDSQETKFDIWKEKNIPPPLPPIDFDF